ncbi:hypothetical protein [Halopelagius fulvigenes]|uniref:Uncharacterized protein n=1 Tax=Halopelagius fulvigenes TaxID=1198324 RepID=A0ABD5U316_9EURY
MLHDAVGRRPTALRTAFEGVTVLRTVAHGVGTRRVAPSEDPATVVEVLLDGTEFAVTDRVPDR